MKKMICVLLVLMLVLAGCQSPVGETTPSSETAPAPETQETTIPTLPESGFSTGPVMGQQDGLALAFENPGKVRLTYDGNRSYVLYVTSVEQLPKEGSWTGYDESYFETKALLIVVETLNSGSVQVDWESILVEGDTANIHIKRTMAGEVGTTDMATWMLWAEVEAGLELNWVLANASQLPQGEKY